MTDSFRGNATINDVARLAGVSKRTVSRVINNSPKVNPDTREKIQQIITQLNYAPSKQARGLASSRSYLLGLIYDEPNAVVIHSVQRGIVAACSRFGYEMVVHPSGYQSDTLVEEVLHFVERSKIDGLVVMPPISANDSLFEALRERGVAYVRLAAKGVDESDRMVISDDRSAMQQVADLFCKQGRYDVGVIVGPSHRLASAERYEGLQAALQKRGINIASARVEIGDFSYQSGYQCAKKILSGNTPPNAVFASNDQMAIATIHAAEDLGIKVPDDLMVVGYDDEPMATSLRPTLTSLRRPNVEMAEAATLKLINAIGNMDQDQESVPTVFTPKLICRQSTGEGV